MGRGDLTNAQWARLEPLLPPQKPKTGRPAEDHRRIIDAIRWIKRTGAPWRDLPERYGPWQTVASRFYRWQQAGLWQRIWSAYSNTPMPRAISIGTSITLMRQWSGLTSTPLAQKRGCRNRRVRAEPGRVQHQGPSPCRRRRQTDDLRGHHGTTA